MRLPLAEVAAASPGRRCGRASDGRRPPTAPPQPVAAEGRSPEPAPADRRRRRRSARRRAVGVTSDRAALVLRDTRAAAIGRLELAARRRPRAPGAGGRPSSTSAARASGRVRSRPAPRSTRRRRPSAAALRPPERSRGRRARPCSASIVIATRDRPDDLRVPGVRRRHAAGTRRGRRGRQQPGVGSHRPGARPLPDGASAPRSPGVAWPTPATRDPRRHRDVVVPPTTTCGFPTAGSTCCRPVRAQRRDGGVRQRPAPRARTGPDRLRGIGGLGKGFDRSRAAGPTPLEPCARSRRGSSGRRPTPRSGANLRPSRDRADGRGARPGNAVGRRRGQLPRCTGSCAAGFTVVYEPTAWVWHRHRDTADGARSRRSRSYYSGHVAHNLTTLVARPRPATRRRLGFTAYVAGEPGRRRRSGASESRRRSPAPSSTGRCAAAGTTSAPSAGCAARVVAR